MTEATLQKTSSFGATMMVTGCCVGAGMIGLPVLSAAAGFFPSFIAILLAYAFTTGTGLLLLEATLWFERQVNLSSIAQFALGRIGKLFVGAFFLFLFYAIFVSYYDGTAALFTTFLSTLFAHPFPREIGLLACVLSVVATLYAGARGVDRVNRLFTLGLAISYCLIVAMSLSHIEPKNLSHFNWKASLGTLPILFISFGYQNMVPSLTYYLRKNVAAIRKAILIGNAIPIAFYAIWNFVILGQIRDPAILSSESGLISELLARNGSSVLPLVQIFSFFALFTSFITVALSFVDFLRDAFEGMFDKTPSDPTLWSLVLLPPLAISLSVPHLFLSALSFAGGFIDLFLYGIFPIAIVWMGRYQKGAQGPYRVAGGKPFLALMFCLTIGFLFLRFV